MVLEIWGFLLFVLGFATRPHKFMRLDRPVSKGERWQLQRQKQALRMAPYMRRVGIALMIVGAVALVIGLIM